MEDAGWEVRVGARTSKGETLFSRSRARALSKKPTDGPHRVLHPTWPEGSFRVCEVSLPTQSRVTACGGVQEASFAWEKADVLGSHI